LKDLNLETYHQHKIGKKLLEVNGKLTKYNSTIPAVSLSSLIDLKWIVTKFNIGSRRLNPIFPFQNLLLAHHLDSVNFDQYLFSNSLSSTSRAIIEASIKSIFGCESNQLNALYALNTAKSIGDGTFETMTGLALDKRVKGGTQQICEKLLEYILEVDLSFISSDNNRKIVNRVLLDAQVTELSQNEYNKDGEKVCVLTTKNNRTGHIEKYMSKKVISSIPLNQYVNIKFEPDLPMYKKNVFNNVHSGNLTKFVITYEKAFWREKGFSGEVVSDGSLLNLSEEKFNEFYEKELGKLTFNKQFPSVGPIVCMYDATNFHDEPALVGFLGGRSSIEWADVDSILRKNEIIDSVVRYFGDEEARNYVDFYGKLN
jgi:monoamine oxidase